MTLRLLRYVWPIGLLFQNVLVDHIGVYTDTKNISRRLCYFCVLSLGTKAYYEIWRLYGQQYTWIQAGEMNVGKKRKRLLKNVSNLPNISCALLPPLIYSHILQPIFNTISCITSGFPLNVTVKFPRPFQYFFDRNCLKFLDFQYFGNISQLFLGWKMLSHFSSRCGNPGTCLMYLLVAAYICSQLFMGVYVRS